jgi:transposase-like protein
MSPRKLSEADKSDILKLYHEPQETTSTLASRYGVSNSTISRILKSNLLESEYEALIQQKRAARTPGGESATRKETAPSPKTTEAESKSTPAPQTPQPSEQPETQEPELQTDVRRRKRRRSSVSDKPQPIPKPKTQRTQLSLEFDTESPVSQSEESEEEAFGEIEPSQTRGFEEFLGEDLLDLTAEDVDLDEDLEEDWEEDEGESLSAEPIRAAKTQRSANVQVLPLSSASLPRTCYLVVDRAAELIARPLKEFSDLGRIPTEEIQEKTLPVFDNHKVARRFSNRTQRVIKVPDGQMLQKTCSHLQAKGITRLLIDGQVYSLVSAHSGA